MNLEENYNCIKFSNGTKSRLKNILSPLKSKISPLSVTTKSENTENVVIPDQVYTPKPNPYRNIFQRLPQPRDVEIKSANTVIYKPTVNKKKSLRSKPIPYNATESVNLSKYVKTAFRFSINLFWKSAEFIIIYGTELIIQVIAITTIACVLVLKFFDKFLKNRHLENCISYVETINFSELKLPSWNLDYIQMYKIIRRVVWIIAKLVGFVLVILKHLLVQSLLWGFFLVSWAIYAIVQFLGYMILFPTVDKTITMLKIDPNVITNLTKFQINRLFISMSLTSQEITPISTDILISIANLRYNIVKVNVIRSGLLGIYETLKSILKTILNVVRSASDFILVLLEFHSMILTIVVLLCNTISMLGYFNYLMFLVVSYVGYVINIFMDILNVLNSTMSKFRKI